jgi:hypothetical protein
MAITENFQPKFYLHFPSFEKEQPHLRVIQKMVLQTLNAGSASLCLGLSDISITNYNQHSSPVYKFGTKQSIKNVLPLKLRTNGKSFTLFPMLIKCLCYPSKREEIIGK